MEPRHHRGIIRGMRRFAIAAVMLGGCAAEDSGDDDSADGCPVVCADGRCALLNSNGQYDCSEAEGSSSEGGSSSGESGGAPGYADGEMFGRCDTREDCDGYVEDASPTTLCRAQTCVEWFIGAVPQGEPTACDEPDAVTVVTFDYPNNYTTCALRARVDDGLGYCPDGMTLVSWVAEDPTLSTTTCWWSDAVVSGPLCYSDSDCGACEPQLGDAVGLPSVCV